MLALSYIDLNMRRRCWLPGRHVEVQERKTTDARQISGECDGDIQQLFDCKWWYSCENHHIQHTMRGNRTISQIAYWNYNIDDLESGNSEIRELLWKDTRG